MILVDTSVWVDHFRRGNTALGMLLDEEHVLCHPLVVGELACGQIRHRQVVLELLTTLPQVQSLEHEELLDFLERRSLFGQGLGWVDIHLLASARLASVPLWTLDRSLITAAERLGVAVDQHGR